MLGTVQQVQRLLKRKLMAIFPTPLKWHKSLPLGDIYDESHVSETCEKVYRGLRTPLTHLSWVSFFKRQSLKKKVIDFDVFTGNCTPDFPLSSPLWSQPLIIWDAEENEK